DHYWSVCQSIFQNDEPPHSGGFMMTATAGSADNQSKRNTKRNLAIFTIIVIAIGWIGRGWDILMGNQASESLGMLLWIIAPFAVSLLLRAFAGDGWRDLGMRPHLKENAVWYGVGILIFPITAMLCLIIGGVSGLITFPNSSLNTIGLLLQAFVLGLLPMFFKISWKNLPGGDISHPKSIHFD
ncbi:MAG: hypothetical protein ACYC9O_17135, partial [Candidatus Latescibacterota bacterium]